MKKILLSIVMCISIASFSQTYHSMFFKLSCDSCFQCDTSGKVLKKMYLPRTFTIDAYLSHTMATDQYAGQPSSIDATLNERWKYFTDGYSFVFLMPANSTFSQALYDPNDPKICFLPRAKDGTIVYWKVLSFQDLDPDQYLPK